MPPSARGGAAFGHRDFRLYEAGRFLTTVGVELQNVAVGWQVYALTGRALDLGLVGLAQFLPVAALSLAAGHAADRFDRRRILVATQLLATVVAAILLALSLRPRGAWPIYAALVLLGVARAFMSPAADALMPSLVPAETFPNAVAWNASTWQVAAIAGPALGGAIYSAGGPAAAYATTGVLVLGGLAAFAAMRIRQARIAGGAAGWRDALAGVRYVWARRPILGAVTLDLFAVLFGGATALLPIYAKDILHTGPWGLGLLRSAPAFGAAVTAFALAWRPLTRRVGPTLFAMVALFGAFTVGFGLSRSLALSTVLLAALGVVDMVSMYVRRTIVQLTTPHEMRGRVGAVHQVFIASSNELGEFESGLAAAWLGAVPAVVWGGVATLAVVGACFLLFPALRRLQGFTA